MEEKTTTGNHLTGTLGTFAGVFTPSILTILGIILFLRTGYVVGSAGLARSLVIIGLANLISILTSVSLSAIATNLKVKGGGDYYLISRTLGMEFGGAIGVVLFLAQSVSIAFYCIGFGEACSASGLFSTHGVSPRIIAAAAVAFLFIFAWMGANWATRFQYVVMALLSSALVSFFIGGFSRWNATVFTANWSSPAGAPPFWVLFALFFPAVTGFTQGVSMSGDLKDPGKSLPMGTFMAVGVSILVYFGAAVIFSGTLSNQELKADYTAMYRISRFSWLIDAGVIAATLSSAMASFLGAPRILQSLAADRIFSFLFFFAKGAGPSANPRRAVVLSGAIACLTIALGNLNLIAPVVSMFFLTSYGLLNYATYYEARAASPSFRPTFKWFDQRLSLMGFLACLGVMLAIDLPTGMIAISILFAIFQYLKRKADPARWADSRRAHHLKQARENLLAANVSPEHPRDWRPQILAFSEDPDNRPQLLKLAGWLEGGSGLTTVVTILVGKDSFLAKKKEEVETLLQRDIREHNPAAFSLVLTTRDMELALHTLLQAHGIGPLRANTILVNWLDAGIELDMGFREFLFGRQLKTLYRLGCNLVILHAHQEPWDHMMETEPDRSRIDLWWPRDATGNLMLLFAYLLTRSESWKGAALRILVFRDDTPEEDQKKVMKEILSDARISAEIVFSESKNAEAIIESSARSTLVFLPFRFHGNLIHLPVDCPAEDLLTKLPPTVMISAAEDIDLDAEPEEGIAAARAEASDLVDKTERQAQTTADEAEQAGKALKAAEIKLKKTTAETNGNKDEERISGLIEDRNKAIENEEKARRRAAKARAKAKQAQVSLENDHGILESKPDSQNHTPGKERE
ncbi:MAG: amino acid permease [Proteobacteria bacterium]|nr:amino acid permease [Pseudomonadota bacterium]MBU4469835.1 amino acid permease [Pseudomonadota bacterium]MCG2753070.1 amino acid permease [Desulfobacteraceae bacterium]